MLIYRVSGIQTSLYIGQMRIATIKITVSKTYGTENRILSKKKRRYMNLCLDEKVYIREITTFSKTLIYVAVGPIK